MSAAEPAVRDTGADALPVRGGAAAASATESAAEANTAAEANEAGTAEMIAAAAMRRVLGNAIALVVAYALPRVLTLAAVVLAARTLGAA